MKLNLCTELASHTSLKTSGWIKHSLVISQGLDPCHAHINYYRSSICDCPSVALATYWMHSRFPESTLPHAQHNTHTHKPKRTQTWSSVLPCPQNQCTKKKLCLTSLTFTFMYREGFVFAILAHLFITNENNGSDRHFLYVEGPGSYVTSTGLTI